MFKRSSGLVHRKFREYLIPTTLSGMSMMLGAIVDGIIVGNTIGANAMAAVNVADPIILLYQALFFLFGMGGTILISIAKGERNQRRANVVFSLGLTLLLGLGLVIVVLGTVFLKEFIGLICNNSALFTLTQDYSRILFWGAPLLLVVPGMVFFIRADGKPRLSASILLVANAVNLVMDLVYIKVFHLGIEGAALATVTGYAVGLVPVAMYWYSKQRTLKLVAVKRRELPLIGEIAGSGMAGAVNTLLLTVKTLCVNLIVMAVAGADGMAVFAVCNFAIAFVSMFNGGATDTMVPLLGMLYGERDWKGIDFVLKRAFSVVVMCSLGSIVLIQLFPVQILALFNVTIPVQVDMGITALRIFSLSLLGLGISYTMMYYLQTTNHRTISISISVLRGFVLIIPCAWFFSLWFGVVGVWWAYIVAESLTIFITLVLCWLAVRRSAGRYKGIFLFETPDETEALYDVSLYSNTPHAVAISERLITFARQNGLSNALSNLVGMAAEEAVIGVMDMNTGTSTEIDIICRIGISDVVLNLRDDGKPLDSMAQPIPPADNFSSRAVLSRIAESVEYTRVLCLNNTSILFKRRDTL